MSRSLLPDGLFKSWRAAAALAALFLLTYLAYRPSLHQAPRADQWLFLIETMHEDHCWPLVTQTYSFSRTRTILPGDYPLFRPVLFALLSAEKALFGHRFGCWQGVGLTLHLLVVGLFLAILLRIQRIHADADGRTQVERKHLKVLAYVLACFFAVNFAGAEMVMWSHIHGYLLFIALALGSILLVLDVLTDESPDVRLGRLAAAYVLLLVAAFTYELGQFYAVVVGLVLGWSAFRQGRRRQALARFALFSSILLVYQAVDRADRLTHADTKPDLDASMVFANAPRPQTLAHCQRYLLYGTLQPFFPSCASWSYGDDRLDIAEPEPTLPANWAANPLRIVSCLVVLALFTLTVARLAPLAANHFRGSTLIVILPLALLVLHMTVIVLGRMNMRPGPGVLSRNSYYAYLPLLMLLLAMYAVCASTSFSGRGPVPARCRFMVPALLSTLIVGLTLLTAASACKVHEFGVHIKNATRPIRCDVHDLATLIDRHRRDPDFKLSFDPACWASFPAPCGVPLPSIFFARYIDDDHPTHIVVRRLGNLQALPVETAPEP